MAGPTRGGFRELVAEELEILPLMNLFVALIPMLLISAVFLQVTVIDMQLPAADAPAAESAAPGLELSLSLEARGWRLEGRGLAPARGDESAESAERLASLLGGLAAAHPGEKDIVILSPPRMRYERIIAAMDIARGAGWPQIALAAATGEGEDSR